MEIKFSGNIIIYEKENPKPLGGIKWEHWPEIGYRGLF